MFDLIASMTVGNTEVTIKSSVGNEASVASVISQVLAGTNNIPQVTPQVTAPVVQKLEPPEEPNPDIPERKAIKVIAVYRKYCEWLFDILFEAEKQIDTTWYSVEEYRVMGYLAERLCGIYYSYLKKQEGIKACELP